MPAQKTTSLLRNVISQLRKRASVTTLSDSTGASLTGRQTLLRALVLRRLLRRAVAPDERNIGVLLPPTVAAAVTNLALALDRRVAVNLNYSLSEELIRFSAEGGRPAPCDHLPRVPRTDADRSRRGRGHPPRRPGKGSVGDRQRRGRAACLPAVAPAGARPRHRRHP